MVWLGVLQLARLDLVSLPRQSNCSKKVEPFFWSQALQLRTPLNRLRLVAPDLAEKLQDISYALEQGSHRNIYYCKLNDDLIMALEEVRKLDGFQEFLRPSPLSALQSAATKGPVVILNAGEYDCAALILMASGVQYVPLPDITVADSTLARSQGSLWSSSPRYPIDPNTVFRSVLEKLWTSVAELIFRSLNLHSSRR